MASPTWVPTVLGLMMSSLRSTFVRCWPSGAPVRPAYFIPVSIILYFSRDNGRGKKTYSVASGVFLLSANHETGSLRCVKGAAALDDGFALDTAGSVLGADASNVVPVLVGHFYDLCCLTD